MVGEAFCVNFFKTTLQFYCVGSVYYKVYIIAHKSFTPWSHTGGGNMAWGQIGKDMTPIPLLNTNHTTTDITTGQGENPPPTLYSLNHCRTFRNCNGLTDFYRLKLCILLVTIYFAKILYKFLYTFFSGNAVGPNGFLESNKAFRMDLQKKKIIITWTCKRKYLPHFDETNNMTENATLI